MGLGGVRHIRERADDEPGTARRGRGAGASCACRGSGVDRSRTSASEKLIRTFARPFRAHLRRADTIGGWSASQSKAETQHLAEIRRRNYIGTSSTKVFAVLSCMARQFSFLTKLGLDTQPCRRGRGFAGARHCGRRGGRHRRRLHRRRHPSRRLERSGDGPGELSRPLCPGRTKPDLRTAAARVRQDRLSGRSGRSPRRNRPMPRSGLPSAW
jgi:hypothetical protein